MSGAHPSPGSETESADRTGGYLILRAVGAISTVCGWIAAAMILSSVFITCQMIFLRFVLNQSTIWQTEAVVYLMIGATLIGLPYVQKHRGHVNVDLLPMMLPMGLRKLLAVVVGVTAIAVIGVMLVYGYEMWHVAFARGWTSDTVWAIQLWIPYIVVPIGFGLFLLQLIADLFAMLIGVTRPFDLAPPEDATPSPETTETR